MDTPDESTPKRRGKSPKPHEFQETTCRDCQCFRERTQTADQVAWGECWFASPDMRQISDDDTGEVDFVPVVKVVLLPYRCYRDFHKKEH